VISVISHANYKYYAELNKTRRRTSGAVAAADPSPCFVGGVGTLIPIPTYVHLVGGLSQLYVGVGGEKGICVSSSEILPLYLLEWKTEVAKRKFQW
jgi:hypothetical protein